MSQNTEMSDIPNPRERYAAVLQVIEEELREKFPRSLGPDIRWIVTRPTEPTSAYEVSELEPNCSGLAVYLNWPAANARLAQKVEQYIVDILCGYDKQPGIFKLFVHGKGGILRERYVHGQNGWCFVDMKAFTEQEAREKAKELQWERDHG